MCKKQTFTATIFCRTGELILRVDDAGMLMMFIYIPSQFETFRTHFRRLPFPFLNLSQRHLFLDIPQINQKIFQSINTSTGFQYPLPLVRHLEIEPQPLQKMRHGVAGSGARNIAKVVVASVVAVAVAKNVQQISFLVVTTLVQILNVHVYVVNWCPCFLRKQTILINDTTAI